jgi:hypothetical protein
MKSVFGLAAAMAVLFAAGAAAQSAAQAGTREEPAARQAPGEMSQLKVQITMSRSKAGAETTNLPFELMLRADGRSQTTLNVGVDVPVPQGPSGSYSYRRVGNNITCGSATYANGMITLNLNVEDSSIHMDAPAGGGGEPGEHVVITSSGGHVSLEQTLAGKLVEADRITFGQGQAHAPVFRSFQTTTTLSMREGETVQFTLATDKQTGETLKVSVSASRVR